MFRKAFSLVIMELLFLSMIMLAFNVRPTLADAQTIYINADGSITPAGAPVVTFDNITYTFTGDISYPTYCGITVERSSIILDGKGYTIQGNQDEYGIFLNRKNNVTVKNTRIEGFVYGICPTMCNYTVTDCILANNSYGVVLQNMFGDGSSVVKDNIITDNAYADIYLGYEKGNIIVGNTIANSSYGIQGWFDEEDASGNIIYHNSFINNNQHIGDISGGRGSYPPFNTWDNGYPSGGNYWSDSSGSDIHSGPYQNETGSDGIGDVPYLIHDLPEGDTDNYPLMKPYYGPVRNLDTGQSYPIIQGAINNATQGNKILALSGMYHENIVVNKTLSLLGQDRSNTIIDGNEKGNVTELTANDVLLSGFTLRNGKGVGSCDSAVFLNNVRNCTISGNNMTQNRYGFALSGSFNNFISDNNIANGDLGVWLFQSNNNTFSGNIVTNNYYEGFAVVESSFNDFADNDLTENGVGMRLVSSAYNKLKENRFTRNNANFGVTSDYPDPFNLSHFIQNIDTSNTVDGRAIYYLINQSDLNITPSIYANMGYLALVNSQNVTVEGMKLENNLEGLLLAFTMDSKIINDSFINNDAGLHLSSASNNVVSYNDISSNGEGVATEFYSNHNIFSQNNLTNNDEGLFVFISDFNNISYNSIYGRGLRPFRQGIEIRDSSENRLWGNSITNNWMGIDMTRASYNVIYNNNFVKNYYQTGDLGTNTWDDGYPSGGNYWSDYSGSDVYSGPYQNVTASDGIGDTPYVMDANNIDNYPLIQPYPAHDVAVDTITATPTIVCQGYGCLIGLTVANKGDFAETFNVTIYANMTDTGNVTVIATFENVTLNSRNSRLMLLMWDTAGFDLGNYTIGAYATPVRGETNVVDNALVDGTVQILQASGGVGRSVPYEN